MNLLFEGWRKFLLNEISFKQAEKRLQAPGQQSKAIKKIIKSAAWEIANDRGVPTTTAYKDFRNDSKIILNNEKYIEVMALFYSKVIRKVVEGIDLDDNQKGVALTWLIALGKTDDLFKHTIFDAIYQEIYVSAGRDGTVKEVPPGSPNALEAFNKYMRPLDISRMDEDTIRRLYQTKAEVYDQARQHGVQPVHVRRQLGFVGRVRPDDTLKTFVMRELWEYFTTDIGSRHVSYYTGSQGGAFIQQQLEKFFHWQQFMAEGDLLKIKTIPKLTLITSEADDAIRKYQEKKSYADAEEGTEIFRDDDELFIAALHNKGASCHWGKGTDWCTAAPGLDYFEEYYTPESPLIIIIDKKGGLTLPPGFAASVTRAGREAGVGEYKYQFHYASDQFMDSRDEEVQIDLASEIHLQIMKTDIPNKYPQIKQKFLQSLKVGDLGYWASITFRELGWEEITDLLISFIDGFLEYQIEFRTASVDSREVTMFKKFMSDGLKVADPAMLGKLLSLMRWKPGASTGTNTLVVGSKEVIKDNIVHIIRAMPEDTNYFMSFSANDIMSFFENREFYDSLPNDLKLKFIRLIDLLGEYLRGIGGGDAFSRTVKRKLGVDQEEPEEQPEEELPEIKERWKRIAGIIL